MAEYQMVVGGFLNKPLTGRRPIETPETEINRVNVLKVVMGKAEPIHLLNKNEIRFCIATTWVASLSSTERRSTTLKSPIALWKSCQRVRGILHGLHERNSLLLCTV